MVEVGRISVHTRLLVQILDQEPMEILAGEVALTSEGSGPSATLSVEADGLASLFEATAEMLRTNEVQ